MTTAARVALFAVLLLPGSALQAQDKEGADFLARILEVYKTRADQMNPIYIRYQIQTVETSAWVRVKSPNGGPPGSEGRTTRVEAGYARKGERVWSFARHSDTAVESAWRREDFCLYNGKTSVRKSGRENEYIVSARPPDVFVAQLPTSISHEREALAALKGWAAGGAPVTAKVVEQKQMGERILAAELWYSKTKWVNKITLLPDRDYAIRRYEVLDASGDPVDEADVTNIGEKNGLNYPMGATLKHYMANRQLGFTQTLTVDEIETEAGKVPDRLFQFEFPPNSQIYDEDTKTYVRQSELTESHLNEVARELSHPPPLWQRWWVVLTTAAVMLSILAFFIRRVVRSRKLRIAPPVKG